MPNRKNMRHLSMDPREPLTRTMEPSTICTDGHGWFTSQDFHEEGLPFRPETVYQMAVYLMANPNITSSRPVQAEILSDIQGIFEMPHETEELTERFYRSEIGSPHAVTQPMPAVKVDGFDLFRTVLTRLVPQNQNLGKPLEQTCHFYASQNSPLNLQSDAKQERNIESSSLQRVLIMHTPHITSPEEMPSYYPMLKSFACLYEFHGAPPESGTGTGTMSLHFLPFSTALPTRLDGALHLILNETIRLSRNAKPIAPHGESDGGGGRNPYKDNIIPRHLVQNTYARIKSTYANDLCQRWIENTEPSKHVFEDLMITAFLIELWRDMYGVTPAKDNASQNQMGYPHFPGFVDIACGNGVIVYVLLMEGYQGCGLDARRRKTWNIFPEWVQEKLTERVFVPKPFVDALGDGEVGVNTHTGDFPSDTFIISNHADELTVWTPLIAALACPTSPLPFLAIPCCSHSLSGSRYRFPPPEKGNGNNRSKENANSADEQNKPVEQNPQSAAGDLRALRAAKAHEKTAEGTLNSMYGSLTAKIMDIAAEVGYEVEKTQLRIPSTRNMGVVGGRQLVTNQWERRPTAAGVDHTSADDAKSRKLSQKIMEIVDRECAREGGIQASARTWVERVQRLHDVHGNRRYPDDA